MGIAAEEQTLEYAVKATYLYKFIPFVEWPPIAHDSSTSPYRICVAGGNPFGSLLDHAVAGIHIGHRPITVHRNPADVRECHVLFATGPLGTVKAILNKVQELPVLTVAEQIGAEATIVFYLDRGKVRFAINALQADEQELRLSSKLLELGRPMQPRLGEVF